MERFYDLDWLADYYWRTEERLNRRLRPIACPSAPTDVGWGEPSHPDAQDGTQDPAD